MALFSADQLDNLLTEISKDKIAPIYLISGDRFLCQQAAEKICRAMLADGGTLHTVDGDAEKFSTTLNKLTSFSLFPGRQVFRITDTRLFHSVKIAESFWKKTVQARQNNNLENAARNLRNMLASAGLDTADPENDPGAIPPSRWKKLFAFTKPQEDLSWTAELLAQDAAGKTPGQGKPTNDDAALLEQALESGLPAQNIALLLAEDVDKRKRLYKYLVDKYTVLDLGVETGSSSKAQTAQKKVLHDLIRTTLAQFAKTMTSEAAELLCERVGFHPVAVAMETEKLALFTGSAKQITAADLNEIVGRTRQEALFELTDALGKKELAKALLIAERLEENGVHPLAVIATLKNYTRSLLLFRALQDQPEYGYSLSLSPGAFQQQILPRLKQKEEWKKELSGHPYALFMQFKTAAVFPLVTLKNWLVQILSADMRLKGSPVKPEIVVQHLIISMLAKTGKAILQNTH